MTLQQLRLFTAVAQLENMSRAAELLHTSQSALSKNIAKLEEEIGVALFTRSGRKIELNAAGARFLECCTPLLRNLDAAVEELRLNATGGDTRIRVGSAGVCKPLLDCMAAFSKLQPGTEFDSDSAIEGAEHIDINDYDVLVYPAGLKYARFTGYRLRREAYYLAVHEGHPLGDRGAVSVGMLAGLDFVFLRQGKDSPETPYGLCTALALQFRSQCFADSRELHRQMIAAGMAAGFVPEGEAEAYRGDSRIRLLPIADERFSRELMICFRRDKHLSERAKAFRDFAFARLGLKD